MAFPSSWPPRVPSGTRSIRFYLTGTTTVNFSDNAYIFADQTAANTYSPLPYVKPGSRDAVTVPLTPVGSGRNANDANPDPAAGAVAPPPAKMIWARALRISNTGASDLEISFDGVNVHGYIKANTEVQYIDRFEAGIAVRGAGGTGTFRIEAW